MAEYNNINKNKKGLRVFPKILVRNYNLITRIQAKDNFISKLPTYFDKLSALQYLNLSGNKFENIPIILERLNNLKEVNFDYNIIQDIDSVSKIKSLTKLSIEGNYIKEIPNEIINLENLESINLTNNDFTTFPLELCRLKNLKKLNLSDNDLYSIPEEIKSLQKLTHLNLKNTQISKLIPEIAELKNLKELHLDGNSLKLPKDYSAKTPYRTIELLLKRQEFAKLKTTKAYVFKNLSKKIIIEKYNSILKEFTSSKGIDIVNIENIRDITKNATVVFFIICYDIHIDNQLVYKLINKCKKLDVNYYILMEEDIIGGKAFVNLSKGAQVNDQHQDLKKKFNINYYNEYDELTNFIFNAVNQRAPNIKLKNIELKNIGHFSNLNIPISENICCLVGENGTGKTTILKAIALAVIGCDFESINKKEIFNLLKIEKLDNDSNRQHLNGFIKLSYSIDGDDFSNEINIVYNKENGLISASKKGPFEISTTGQNLKSLILGFPQIRGGILRENVDRKNKLNQPHIDDVLPLINEVEDYRLNSFGNWIVQLYFEAVKKEYESKKNKKEIKEWLIITKAFDVISSFSDYDISFKTVETGEPPTVWVKTFGAPNGIPLNLVSQGFKVVMGWLGYFIQRLIESYPVQSPDQVSKSHAVLIIDEVDSYIHPKWQAKILNILRQIFPNCQFIMSTHSPIAISSCNEGEVIVLDIDKNEIYSKTISNTKGWLVENILLDIMGVNSTRDIEITEKIIKLEKLILKKVNETITSKERKELNDLIKDIDNLPAGDPVITLLNLRAIGESLTK